jgi:hypothetical protein
LDNKKKKIIEETERDILITQELVFPFKEDITKAKNLIKIKINKKMNFSCVFI